MVRNPDIDVLFPLGPVILVNDIPDITFPALGCGFEPKKRGGNPGSDSLAFQKNHENRRP